MKKTIIIESHKRKATHLTMIIKSKDKSNVSALEEQLKRVIREADHSLDGGVSYEIYCNSTGVNEA